MSKNDVGDIMKKFWIKFKQFNRTIPFWHNWTGPSHKGGEPVTPLDVLAKQHDKEVCSTTWFGAFDSIEKSRGNIAADWNFIKSFLWYLINVPTDMIVGCIGVFIFVVNIGLNYINVMRGENGPKKSNR